MTTNERPTPDEIGTWEPDYRAIMGSPQIAHRDKRAVQMANDEQPSPDQAGTWEPDWRLLKQTRDKAITNIPYANDDQFNECAYRAVVSEYRRQQAAQGMVEVRRETLQELVNRYSGLRDRYYREAREILAAATEQL